MTHQQPITNACPAHHRTSGTTTHEAFIASVVQIARARLNDDDRAIVDNAKIVYGAGQSGLRGTTYFSRWQNGDPEPHSFVEICAFGESDAVQLAGTTLHELAHVLAGYDAGHGKAWKATCARLGLRKAMAAGQQYMLAYFAPDIRFAVAGLKSPADGKPVTSRLNARFTPTRPKPCGVAIGVRGGTSRGKGSGSRLRKVECGGCGYVARVTTKWLERAGAPLCPCNQAPMAHA